jgi:DNA-3-methyladenine glycosylase I
MKHDLEYLAQLLDLAEQTVASCTDWVPDGERERQSYCDTLDRFARETDDGFFSSHVAVVFFSGFRASVVEARLPAIRNAFPSIGTVLAYGSDHIDALMGNPGLIRNRAKITAVTGNARSFQSIIDVPIRYVDTILVSLGMTSAANLYRKTEPQ